MKDWLICYYCDEIWGCDQVGRYDNKYMCEDCERYTREANKVELDDDKETIYITDCEIAEQFTKVRNLTSLLREEKNELQRMIMWTEV